jgi:hypothetical protein
MTVVTLVNLMLRVHHHRSVFLAQCSPARCTKLLRLVPLGSQQRAVVNPRQEQPQPMPHRGTVSASPNTWSSRSWAVTL